LVRCVRLASSRKTIYTPDLAKFALVSEHKVKLCLSEPWLFPDQTPIDRNGEITLFRTCLSTTAAALSQLRRAWPMWQLLSIHLEQPGNQRRAASKHSDLRYLMSNFCRSRQPENYTIQTYSCMSLFHGTTFLTKLAYSVGTSGTFCITRKFSASKFWKDASESCVTSMWYVGEVYPSSYDHDHKCIVATRTAYREIFAWRSKMFWFARDSRMLQIHRRLSEVRQSQLGELRHRKGWIKVRLCQFTSSVISVRQIKLR
jgi:hypothetical protein